MRRHDETRRGLEGSCLIVEQWMRARLPAFNVGLKTEALSVCPSEMVKSGERNARETPDNPAAAATSIMNRAAEQFLRANQCN